MIYEPTLAQCGIRVVVQSFVNMTCCSIWCTTLAGFSLLLLSGISTTALYCIVKTLTLTTGHFTSIVSLFSLLAIVPVLCFRGSMVFVCTRPFTLVLLKCSTESLAFIMRIWVVKNMFLGDAVVLFSTSYLFSAILGRVFLKEKLSVVRVLGSIFGFTGVILILKPVFLFSNVLQEYSNNNAPGVATASAVLSGVAYCSQRYLNRLKGSHTDYCVCNDVRMVFYEQIILCALGFLFDVIIGDPPAMPQCGASRGYYVLCSVLCLGTILAMKQGRDCDNYALSIRSADVVLAYIAQFTLYNESSDFVSLFGAVTISVCTSAVAIHEVFRSAKGRVDIRPAPPSLDTKRLQVTQTREWDGLRDFDKQFVSNTVVLEEEGSLEDGEIWEIYENQGYQGDITAADEPQGSAQSSAQGSAQGDSDGGGCVGVGAIEVYINKAADKRAGGLSKDIEGGSCYASGDSAISDNAIRSDGSDTTNNAIGSDGSNTTINAIGSSSVAINNVISTISSDNTNSNGLNNAVSSDGSSPSESHSLDDYNSEEGSITYV